MAECIQQYLDKKFGARVTLVVCKYSTITLANVLNVCPEAHERFTILRHAHGAFKQSDRKATCVGRFIYGDHLIADYQNDPYMCREIGVADNELNNPPE